MILFNPLTLPHNALVDYIINNGALGLIYPLLFIYIGYKTETVIKSENVKPYTSLLKRIAAVTITSSVFACVIYTISTFKINSPNISNSIVSFLLMITRGGPTTLWFIPAAVLGAFIVSLLKKHLGIKKIIIISAIIYVLSLFICTYIGLYNGILSKIRDAFEFIFSYSHCGLFSAMIFISSGMFAAENEPKKSSKKYLIMFFISLACLIAEITILLKIQSDILSDFSIFTVPCGFFAFRTIQSRGELKSEVPGDPLLFGSYILIFGQLFSHIYISGTAQNTIWSNLISFPERITETVLILTCLLVFLFCAIDRKSEKILHSFLDEFQSAVLYILRPFAYVSSKVERKTKELLIFISFAALPVLLWFIESLIEYDTCIKLFNVFLAFILFFSLDNDISKPKKSPSLFTAPFAAISIMILCTSHLYRNSSFEQIGRMMLYFIIPLSFVISNTKDGSKKLFKNYTDGMYLSFAIFCVYCFLLRPYDITRYSGAFCNSNMSGLYTVTICAIALCNIPYDIKLREIFKHPLHWIIFSFSFAFSIFTISRTALVGLICIITVKILGTALCGNKKNNSFLHRFKKLSGSLGIFICLMCIGTVVIYSCIRFLPLLTGTPYYTLTELTSQYEYKVLPGAKINDSHFISLRRFFDAWMNRSVFAYSSADEMSTGRLTIYKEYLKNISFEGHRPLRILIPEDGNYMFAHNAFLQVAYNCGLITGIAYLLYNAVLFFTGLRKCFVTKNPTFCSISIAIAAYASCGLFESMETYTYPLLLLALGAFMFLPDLKSRPSAAEKETEEQESSTDLEYSPSIE